jgi:hypothetical protein
MTTFWISGIQWDTEGEDAALADLPDHDTVSIARDFDIGRGEPVPDDAIDAVLDALSDRHGWCVLDCIINVIEE